MSDFISRQAAIDALDKIFDSIPMEQTTEILTLRRALRDLPSAQPEQITCKDCNHCTFNAGAKIYCDELDMRMYQWDYCSRAERREDAQ